MKTIKKAISVLAILAGLAGWASGAYEPVTAVSENTAALDTRGFAVASEEQNDALDTRSSTTKWSVMSLLNTKKILRTIIMLK